MSRKPLILEKWDFIVLLGESGGGKGTLVKNIRHYWLPELKGASMGDIFRRKSAEDPEIQRMTEQGILINDNITFEVFKEFAEANQPGLIDGYPRNRQQALDLIKFVKQKGWRVLVVDIHCTVEQIIERLLARNRADDKLNIIYKRHTDHLHLHPLVMGEIKTRPDLFDVIHLDGTRGPEISFTSFLLYVLRLVDMLYFYELNNVETTFKVEENEASINPAINRWMCGFLRDIQENIAASNLRASQ
ncbi:MAG: nucleoside monophosphate kinase [Defluviitaleaceae bacterium]|nr:nucleoside monophosphate kinase [Defluviitaleaceae bacterium]